MFFVDGGSSWRFDLLCLTGMLFPFNLYFADALSIRLYRFSLEEYLTRNGTFCTMRSDAISLWRP